MGTYTLGSHESYELENSIHQYSGSTIHFKAPGLPCYAIMEVTLIGLRQPLVINQSQARRQSKLSQHVSVDTLSQHAVIQSQTREARHAIPACNNIDKLSQHAITQSWAREARHTIQAYS